jgi:hypothetical protein
MEVGVWHEENLSLGLVVSKMADFATSQGFDGIICPPAETFGFLRVPRGRSK